MFPFGHVDIHPSELAIIFDLGQSALFEFLILCYRFRVGLFAGGVIGPGVCTVASLTPKLF